MMVMSAMIGNSTDQVNGYLTGRSLCRARSSYRSMIEDVLKRVEQRLEAVDMTATAASRLAGLSEDAIRNMRRATAKGGRKGVSTDTLSKLAPVLRTTTGWLLDGVGPEEVEEDGEPTVPLLGKVGAGNAAHFYATADETDERVPAPRDATPQTRAARISGPSLGSHMEGWLVYFDGKRDGVPAQWHGQLCVVGLVDDRVLVKWVRPGSGPGFYHLESTAEPTMFDEEVVWSALVKEMRPR